MQHNKALFLIFMHFVALLLYALFFGQLLSVLVSLPAYAQVVATLQNDSARYDLTPKVQTLYDTTGKLTFAQVSSPTMQARFKRESKSKRNIQAHWYKIDIDNQTAQTQFQIENYSLFQSELYVVQGERIFHYTNGFKTKVKDRAYLGRIFQYPITLGKGKTTLYFVYREASTYKFRVGNQYFDLLTAQEAFIGFHNRQIITWLVLGILLALILYNAFLYAILRDISYGYYVLSVGCFLGYIVFEDRSIINRFDVSSFYYNRLSYAFSNVCVGLFGVFFIKFTQNYLNTRLLYKSWHYALQVIQKCLYASSALMVVADMLKEFGILYIKSSIAVGIHTFCLGSMALCLLLLSYKAWRRGGDINNYYAYSNTILFVFGLITASAHPAFGLFQNTLLTSISFEIGMAGQMIAFSIALAGRINVLKAEIVAKQLAHERLERDITEKKNIELELKVKERTRDLEQSNEEVRAQASQIERQARLLEDQKNRQLMNKTLEILQKNEFIPEVGKFLEKLSPQLDDQLKKESKELQKKMTQNLHADAHWENLKLHFEETHPNLFAVLHERCPKLSPNDLRHCAYQKMGLSKKEIASLLNLDPASVNKQQYRIKQKLQLDEDVSFADFIMGIH